MSNSGIYEIIHIESGKRYIGSAKSFAARFKDHRALLRSNRHHSRILQNAWNKHGENGFGFNKLIECTQENLVFYEQRFIDAWVPEYNVCKVAGSSRGTKQTPETIAKKVAAITGLKRSPETRQRIRDALLGKPKSPEHRQKLSASLAGKAVPHRRGEKRSDDVRQKMSESAKRRNLRPPSTPESIEKRAAQLRGRPLSEEHKEKLRTAGRKRRHSAESRAKMSATRRRIAAENGCARRR
jgi:group I intron endonuclease